jgi:2-dehydropantoate 2-reductase
MQDVVDDRRLRRVVAASMRETVRVGVARGIRFGSLQGLGDRRLRFFARLPLTLAQVLPWSMRVRMGDVPNLGSTQQSLRRGQLTEVDFLNGAVVREADAAGREAPVNRALVELVHEVERGRASLPTERVLAVLDRAGA